MGGVMGWLAYIWLVTSEFCEELFYFTIGDSARRLFSATEFREQEPRIYPRTHTMQSPTAKAADTV